MENSLLIFLVPLIILMYGFFSKSLDNYNISGPMVFLFIGLMISPLAFNLTQIHINQNIIQVITEIALILVLFTDSSSINLKRFRRIWKIPTRLLFIGLPLTIIFSTYVATLFFPDEPLLYILLMTLILAPTDAALGKAVVTDNAIPKTIRSSINIESGLNDGIVFPMLITVLLLINAHEQLGADYSWLSYLVQQIAFGFFFGASSGFLGAKLLTHAVKHQWITETYRNLSPVSLAVMSYYIAEYFGGNGFISAYTAGMFFGSFSKIINTKARSFLESEGEVLILISFLVFGLSLVPITIEHWDTKVVVYSFLSLTVFRILPVVLSLSGLNISWGSKLFIGWFGPRGIASILYILVVVHQLEVLEKHTTLYSVITLTILLSIIFHGLTAKPLAKLYKKG